MKYNIRITRIPTGMTDGACSRAGERLWLDRVEKKRRLAGSSSGDG